MKRARINKKSLSLTINIIIIAIIAVVVMLFLIMLFTGRLGKFRAETESCSNRGGECKSPDECVGPYMRNLGQYDCEEGLICCLSVSPIRSTGE